VSKGEGARVRVLVLRAVRSRILSCVGHTRTNQDRSPNHAEDGGVSFWAAFWA